MAVKILLERMLHELDLAGLDDGMDWRELAEVVDYLLGVGLVQGQEVVHTVEGEEVHIVEEEQVVRAAGTVVVVLADWS